MAPTGCPSATPRTRTRSCLHSIVQGLLEPQFEPVGIAAVHVVAVQPLVAQEAQVLVQPNRPRVLELGFQDDLGISQEVIRGG